MARTVKCGLIQARNAAPTDASIDEIKRLNIEKHVAMIADAAKQGGLVERAEGNTRTTLDTLLKALGFTSVTVTFVHPAAGG